MPRKISSATGGTQSPEVGFANAPPGPTRDSEPAEALGGRELILTAIDLASPGRLVLSLGSARSRQRHAGREADRSSGHVRSGLLRDVPHPNVRHGPEHA